MASDTQITKIVESGNFMRLCVENNNTSFGHKHFVEDSSYFVFDPALANNISVEIFDWDGYLQVNNQLPSGFVFDNGEFEYIPWILHKPGD